MAEGTFRPERRPLDQQDAAANRENLEKMTAIRQQATNEVMPDAPGGGPVEFKGNLPPAFMAARQAAREEEYEENPSAQRHGPRQRPEKQQPQESATGMTTGDNHKKLEQLIAGVKNSKIQHERIVLPSKGKFYDGEDGPTDGILHIRPMTGEEEQILATPRFVKRGEAVNMIFNRCVEEKFNSAKFLTPDRTYLLIYLRGISYSPNYEVEVKCPNCDRKFGTEINLDGLYVDNCPDDFGQHSLEDTLPTSGYSFRYRLSTGEDEQRVQEYQDRKMRGFETAGQSNDTLLYRTALMVENIEGLSDKVSIQKLLRSLPIHDVAYLRTVVNEPPFGVDTKVEIPCESCLQDFEIDLPLEAGFFFPRPRKKGRTQA
jgi:hypothetical protein